MKTAVDPFFASNIEPVTAARRGQAVTVSAADLPHVTSSLLINVATAGNISVLFPDDPDSSPTVLGFAVGTFQINIQVRAITAIGAGITVVALWS